MQSITPHSDGIEAKVAKKWPNSKNKASPWAGWAGTYYTPSAHTISNNFIVVLRLVIKLFKKCRSFKYGILSVPIIEIDFGPKSYVFWTSE